MSTIIRTVAILGRRKDLSFEEFCRYWRKVYRPLAAQLPGLMRYVQRHVQAPSAEFEIDGFAPLDYERAEASRPPGRVRQATGRWFDYGEAQNNNRFAKNDRTNLPKHPRRKN